MPPFVDNVTASAMPEPSVSSSEMLARSKSADDLLRLKCMAATLSLPVEGERSHSAQPDIRRERKDRRSSSPAPSSTEWVGSYFFESFARSNPAKVSNDSEDDLVVVHPAVDEGDDSTVGAYFAESDFVPSNWTSAAEYIPPVGFAVVAGGLCMLNPIVFIGGILTACTALGAVHAAQTSYSSCIDGDLCQIFDSSREETSKVAKDEARDDTNPRDAFPLKRDVSEVTFNVAGMEDAVSEVDLSSLNIGISGEAPLPQDPSTLETAEQALEWVNLYYPPLAYKNVDNLEFSGLNALEIFDVFLADDAPFTFSEFQKKRQDKNIRYGKWEDLTGVTQPSLVQAAATISAPSEGNESPTTYHDHLKERVLHFQAKTNSGLFGPPYATTTKVQRCLVANKRLLVLESKTTLKDIPFCDRFYVLERWLFTSRKQEDQYVSCMSVSSQVVFTQGCPFEQTILTKSQDTVTEVALQWNEMAINALEKTEQARQERLNQDQENDDATQPTDVPKTTSPSYTRRNDMDSSIEVERLSRTVSRIIGQENDESISVTTGEDGRPPAGPTAAVRRKPSVRRQLSRSLSSIMKRRKSNPL